MEINTLKCFLSYSHKDKRMCNKFLTHLNNLSQTYKLECKYICMIREDQTFDKGISDNILNSEIVFLLISPDYIGSSKCFEKELKLALKRHSRNECIVIPVIIRGFVNGEYLFSKLNYVPTNGKPVDNFKTQNDGFVDAFFGIKNLIEKFLIDRSKKSKVKNSSYSKNGVIGRKNVESSAQIKYELVKSGKVVETSLKQKDFDNLVFYVEQLPQILNEINKLIDNQLSHFSTVISRKDVIATVLKSGKNDMESFLLQLFSYIQRRLIGIENTCMHFRVEKNEYYNTFSEVGYPLIGLKTEPIKGCDSIIGISKLLDMPVIKEFNRTAHKKTHPYETIYRNYITFTFNNISQIYGINISMCISVTGKGNYKGIFIPMAVLRFDRIIENYLIMYIKSCEKLNPNYDIKKILSYGGK